MDMIKIGQFLTELRKENNMTQAQLGEKLGVSNKTISRWETGTYMPPVEMLQLLSDMYQVSINEILSGQRLSPDTYKEMAEENIKSALSKSAFTLKDKIAFYKKKWIKDHIFLIILAFVVWFGLVIAMGLRHLNPLIVGIIGGMMASSFYSLLHNQMMTYVDANAFDGKGGNL